MLEIKEVQAMPTRGLLLPREAGCYCAWTVNGTPDGPPPAVAFPAEAAKSVEGVHDEREHDNVVH